MKSIRENIKLGFKEYGGEFVFLAVVDIINIADGGRRCYCVCGSVKVM